MRSHRFATVLVLAGALGVLAACIDWLAPQPGPAGLNVSLLLEEGVDGPRLALDATFSPGPDAGGAPAAVARDTLWVWDDHPFTTHRTTYDGDLVYRETREMTAGELARRNVSVTGPRLLRAPAPQLLRVPVIIRDGPDTVSTGPEGDLALPVRVPDMVPEVESVRWLLFVVNAATESNEAPRIRLEGEEPPPPSIEISAEELKALGDGPLDASFFVLLEARRESPVDYPHWLSLHTRWHWRILRGEESAP